MAVVVLLPPFVQMMFPRPARSCCTLRQTKRAKSQVSKRRSPRPAVCPPSCGWFCLARSRRFLRKASTLTASDDWFSYSESWMKSGQMFFVLFWGGILIMIESNSNHTTDAMFLSRSWMMSNWTALLRRFAMIQTSKIEMCMIMNESWLSIIDFPNRSSAAFSFGFSQFSQLDNGDDKVFLALGDGFIQRQPSHIQLLILFHCF